MMQKTRNLFEVVLVYQIVFLRHMRTFSIRARGSRKAEEVRSPSLDLTRPSSHEEEWQQATDARWSSISRNKDIKYVLHWSRLSVQDYSEYNERRYTREKGSTGNAEVPQQGKVDK